MIEINKPDFKMSLDNNGQAIPAMSLKPDCIKALADGSVIDCTDKTIISFENDVKIQIAGVGYTYNLPANKELCISDIDSLTVTGIGNYIII